MRYSQLVEELFPRLTGQIRWGLERTTRLLAEAGDPHRRYPTVHVGGTNGKGSVSATLASILGAAGRRIGLYTSPHLCSFRERIQVDGRPLSEDAILAAAARLWPAIQREEASFFEATTAIAFLALADAEAEAVVAEVGLGGRLDATNVLEPWVAAITNIAMDHAEYLGPTLERIAAEKAGIIKPGVPVVTAETTPALLDILRRRGDEVGAPVHALEPGAITELRVESTGTSFVLETPVWGRLALRTPLIGAHQARNAATAVLAAGLLPEEARPTAAAVREGVARVRWPGRFQIERIAGRCWVFDVAHNPAGAAALADTLNALALPGPRIMVFAVMAEKHWPAMLPHLLSTEPDAVVLTVPPSAPAHRRWDPTPVARLLPAGRAVVEPELERALELAVGLAGGTSGAAENGSRAAVALPATGDADPGGVIVVTGSAHTVGDALLALGRPSWPDLAVPREDGTSPEPRVGADPPLHAAPDRV